VKTDVFKGASTLAEVHVGNFPIFKSLFPKCPYPESDSKKLQLFKQKKDAQITHYSAQNCAFRMEKGFLSSKMNKQLKVRIAKSSLFDFHFVCEP